MHPDTSRPDGRARPTGHHRPDRSTPAPLLRLDDVSVTAHRSTLLAPTSLHVGPGRIVALRGENGSGKTTLLRTIAGRTRPTTGSVTVAGRPVDERDPGFRRRVAALIGLPPLAPDLTVIDHVTLVSSTWERDAGAVESATSGVLDGFGLSGLSSRFPHELSSGQTQLLALALVFVRPFDVLLLDEPEQRLDPGRVDLLVRAMRARCTAGATIIAATHSEVLARATADVTVALTSAS